MGMDQNVEKVIEGIQDPTLQGLLREYFESNEAARIFVEQAARKGWPVILDHMAIRCLNVEQRAGEFVRMGYRYNHELVEYPDQGWWAKVYRKKGFPTLFIDQAYTDHRGEKSILAPWVAAFGDQVLHHLAVRVEDIEQAIEILKAAGVEFSGSIVGPKGTRLRQIFTASEVKKGKAYSVLELTERNQYEGFVPEQADGLMQSSVKTKGASSKGK
jgi:catechol 2,3-dioxygenase-like lactoylglutathione lyase family enzyme